MKSLVNDAVKTRVDLGEAIIDVEKHLGLHGFRRTLAVAVLRVSWLNFY